MKKFVITIIILLIIGVVGFSTYYYLNSKNEEPTKEEKTTKNTLPKEDEPYKNETKVKSNFVEDSEEVELKYDQYVTANGYSGASDNIYYTRNGVLYHLVLSTEKTTRLAEGVDRIESDLDCLRAYKGNNFKIIQEDEYVIYED